MAEQKEKRQQASRSRASGRARQTRGEQTRLKILDGVLQIIAREGTRGVTHRSVAKAAGVQPSLTTYYFNDIDEMIQAAFGHFSDQARPGVESLLRELEEYLGTFTATQLRRRDVRQTVCDSLAARAADYLVAQIRSKPVGLAVEQVFFTHTRLSPVLRRMGESHRQQLLKPLVKLCTHFNKEDPEVDAELLLITVTTLEYQSLAIPSNRVDRDRLEGLVRRQLGWIVGLSRE